MSDEFEYWDCEDRVVRVAKDGKCEVYAGGGKWETDKTQRHPKLRGMSVSSDNTPVDGAELADMMKRADAKAR